MLQQQIRRQDEYFANRLRRAVRGYEVMREKYDGLIRFYGRDLPLLAEAVEFCKILSPCESLNDYDHSDGRPSPLCSDLSSTNSPRDSNDLLLPGFEFKPDAVNVENHVGADRSRTMWSPDASYDSTDQWGPWDHDQEAAVPRHIEFAPNSHFPEGHSSDFPESHSACFGLTAIDQLNQMRPAASESVAEKPKLSAPENPKP